jgi:two-component system OmpR family response regulator
MHVVLSSLQSERRMMSASSGVRQHSLLSAPFVPAARVLLIDDDAELAGVVVDDLRMRGYQVDYVATGTGGVEAAETANYDAVIVDRVLPGLDGIAVIGRLRDSDPRLPILMLSAMRELDHRIDGLTAGCDDYLTKPFELAELAARLAALLRRSQLSRESVLRVDTLVLDLIERTVHRGTRVIELLPREFKLLEYLIRHVGRPVTRQMLLEDVWNYRFVPETNLVDVHIGRLRRKIDAPGEPPLIHSIRGTGFVISAPT